MAETPRSTLIFAPGCPDCGRREVELPARLPALGDDFDWLQRDYDSFRLAMLQELAARFPERRRWSPADMEVVLVEALAVVLDQLSDMSDRVQAEAFLETARQPESVRRLLALIGYNPLEEADTVAELERGMELDFDPGDPALVAAFTAGLERWWRDYPHRIDDAKLRGPRSIHRQRRMVTEADYAMQLEAHPLVERAHAWISWTGSWTTVRVACVCVENVILDTPVLEIHGPGTEATTRLQAAIEAFHQAQSLDLPNWDAAPSVRSLLREFLNAYRMAGQEVWLQNAEPVGVVISLSVRLLPAFYQSEVRRAVEAALGNDLGGFFEPGRLRFGEDLHVSDLVEVVMALDGVEAICLNRFKRIGRRYADQSDGGRIVLEGIEVAVCDNDPTRPERGTLRVTVHGGLVG